MIITLQDVTPVGARAVGNLCRGRNANFNTLNDDTKGLSFSFVSPALLERIRSIPPEKAITLLASVATALMELGPVLLADVDRATLNRHADETLTGIAGFLGSFSKMSEHIPIYGGIASIIANLGVAGIDSFGKKKSDCQCNDDNGYSAISNPEALMTAAQLRRQGKKMAMLNAAKGVGQGGSSSSADMIDALANLIDARGSSGSDDD